MHEDGILTQESNGLLDIGFRRRGGAPASHGLVAQKHWVRIDGVDVGYDLRIWMGEYM